MTKRDNIKEDRRQISFYPTIEMIAKIDTIVKSEGGKSTRSYILECIVEDWFERTEKGGNDNGKQN